MRRCYAKQVFLKLWQNSQENTCVGVSLTIKLQAQPATSLKERLRHRYFPVNFAKFLGTPFTMEHLPVASPKLMLNVGLTQDINSFNYVVRAVQHYTPPDGKQFCIYCCFYMSQLNNLDISEAATGTVLSKKLFVKIWNYSQKTNDVGVPFFARLKT